MSDADRESAYGTLDHERLDAYRVALELDDLVVRIARSCARGYGWLCDQAQRASGSTVLNLAEAVGRDGPDRARCIRIARGSALEADAAIKLLLHRGMCSSADRAKAHELVGRLMAMFTKLIASSTR
jgi:four helix bundle protein